jgi:hypothetical protein
LLVKLVGRTTCLYCAQDGVETPLTLTTRGGFCPIHGDKILLAELERAMRAERFLSLPEPDTTRGRSAARKADIDH